MTSHEDERWTASMDWQQLLDDSHDLQEALPDGIGAEKHVERQQRDQLVQAVYARFPAASVRGWMENAPWDAACLTDKTQAIVLGERRWGPLAITEAEVEQAALDVLRHQQAVFALKYRGSVPQFMAMAPNVTLGTHAVDLPVVVYQCPGGLDLPHTGYDRNAAGGKFRDNPDKGRLVGFYRADNGFAYLQANRGVILK